MLRSIGMVELTSVGIGCLVEDTMLKAGAVELVLARTICSGKYMVVVSGDVAGVRAAVEAGMAASQEGLIDHLVIPSVHEAVFPAIGGSVALDPSEMGALGIVETYSAAAAIEAADAAAKAASVTLFRIHLAMALGGKGFVQMTGAVADVEAAVEAGAAVARNRGLLVSEVVIPRPQKELFAEYI
ncbi:MAG: BMC domain-containing protein [Phycisphaerae bacterium]|nr:BMC domain-containing protein [Phycisphaerae bacterium]